MTDNRTTAEQAADHAANAIEKALDARIARQLNAIAAHVADVCNGEGPRSSTDMKLTIAGKRTLENSAAFKVFQDKLKQRGITTRLYTSTSGQGYGEVETDHISISW